MDRRDLIAKIDQAFEDGDLDDISFKACILDFLDTPELEHFVQFLKERGVFPPDEDEDDECWDDPETQKVLDRGYF